MWDARSSRTRRLEVSIDVATLPATADTRLMIKSQYYFKILRLRQDPVMKITSSKSIVVVLQ
jgi:hypothetical protein